jgi:protein-tyrosine phosphatase
VIDLHSHLLPGVDDGARSVAQSVAALRLLAEAGVTDVCLTPHLTASALGTGVPDAHDAAWAALQPEVPPGIRLHRGAEVMLDRALTAADAAQPAFRIAGSRYMLVEFPRMVSSEAVANALWSVVQARLVPLLAHPERYSVCSPAQVARWRSLGAVMQVDATTALQATRRGDRARALLAHGLADIVAGDNHGDERTTADLRRALAERGDGEAGELLTTANPRAILDDRATVPVPAVEVRLPLRDRVRRLFGASD